MAGQKEKNDDTWTDKFTNSFRNLVMGKKTPSTIKALKDRKKKQQEALDEITE